MTLARTMTRGVSFPLVLALYLCWAGVALAAPDAAPLSDAAPALERLAKQAEDATLPESQRLELIRALGDWGTEQVRPALVTILNDPSPSIRAAAAHALGWPANREAIPALREHADNPTEDATVRAMAVEALGRIGDRSARPAVVALARDPEGAVRGAALWSLTLGPLADPADRNEFLRQAAEDQAVDPLTRCRAIEALGEARDAAAADSLVRLLENEPPVRLRLPKAPTQQQVMTLRYRESRDVRAWAARALGMIDARSALPLLLKTAEEHGDFFLRLTSAQTLAAWAAPEATEVLVRLLDDPFEETRVAALAGLARIRARSAVDPVLARLSDGVPEVRAQAVTTLADLGDPRVRPQLEALWKTEEDPRVHQALKEALGRLGH
jgi:HEAT repeat protein